MTTIRCFARRALTRYAFGDASLVLVALSMGLWWLMVAHVAYLLFMHFLRFHQATPELNLLQSWFAGPTVPVLGLRAAAYLRIVGAKRISEPPKEGTNHAPV